MMGALIIAKICCHGCLRTSLFTFSPSQTQVGIHQQHCLLIHWNRGMFLMLVQLLNTCYLKLKVAKPTQQKSVSVLLPVDPFPCAILSSLSEGRLPNAVPANSCQTKNYFQYQKWKPYKVRKRNVFYAHCFNNERMIRSSCPTLSASAELISQEWLYAQSHDGHGGCAGFSTKLRLNQH